MNAMLPPAGPDSAGYEEIEHTADRAAHVWGEALPGLFEQAARAMFALMIPLETIRPRQTHHMTLACTDREAALIEWLNELLFWRETRHELYSQFGVEIEGEQMRAWFAGEPAEPALAVIKAATFHNLHVAQDERGMWHATIVFDT